MPSGNGRQDAFPAGDRTSGRVLPAAPLPRKTNPGAPGRQHGFSFLFVLLLVSIIGFGLAAAGGLWQTDARRAREAELLFVGNQYREAIRQYYELDANQPRLPQTVDELLLDSRRPTPLRHLRRAYPDPMTGETFELVRTPDTQGITGVRSRSRDTPLKVAGFDAANAGFSEARTYMDWVFLFQPKPAGPASQPPTPPAGSDGTQRSGRPSGADGRTGSDGAGGPDSSAGPDSLPDPD